MLVLLINHRTQFIFLAMTTAAVATRRRTAVRQAPGRAPLWLGATAVGILAILSSLILLRRDPFWEAKILRPALVTPEELARHGPDSQAIWLSICGRVYDGEWSDLVQSSVRTRCTVFMLQ